MKKYLIPLLLSALMVGGCSRKGGAGSSSSASPASPAVTALQSASPAGDMERAMETLQLTSTAFKAGERIPTMFTGDGSDQAPPLTWSAGPAGTKSYAIIMDDPDAPRGTWVHWVGWDIPSSVHAMAQGDARGATGANSWGTPGYRGPSPPPGNPHRYFFRLYALDVESLGLLPQTTTSRDLRKAMMGHILAEGELMGTYSR